MVGFSLDFDFPNIKVESAKLSRFSGKIRSFREPLKNSIRDIVAPSIRENFDTGGRPAWEGYASSTKKRKKYPPFGKRLLIRTGRLRSGASQQNVWKLSSDQATVNGLPAAVSYGYYHQSGTEHLPARPFMMIQPEDEDAIEELFKKWVNDRMSESGL